MLSEITTFTPTSINGTTMVGDLKVNVNVTENSIAGNVNFPNSPGQYLSVNIDKMSGKSSVSFSAEDSAAMLVIIENITAKLLLIKEELGN